MGKLQELADLLSNMIDRLQQLERDLELDSTLHELKIDRDEQD